MLSLPQRLAARIAQLDSWEDGGGIILDHQAGAHISSYTGPHAWNAGAGHEPPSAEPILVIVRNEIAREFDSLPVQLANQLAREFAERCLAFDQRPSMPSLIALATVVDSVSPLYLGAESEVNLDMDNDVVEHEYGEYEDD